MSATTLNMYRYGKGNRDTAIFAYEFNEHSITILFKDGYCYLYTDRDIGQKHLKVMKLLAENGKNLSTYINQHEDVRNGYDRKWMA